MKIERELRDYLADCTVRIETAVGRGSGFLIAPKLVLTCARFVEDTANGTYPYLSAVKVVWKGNTYAAKVVRYAASPVPDAAILEAEMPDHPCAYLFAPVRPSDPLYACGHPPDGDREVRIAFDGADWSGQVLKLRPTGSGGPELGGAPLLNLRTGGVCGMLKPGASGGPRATPVSVILGLFPRIEEAHDAHHESRPHWFESLGAAGTVFSARALRMATLAACEEPVQRLLAPGGAHPMTAWYAPLTFRRWPSDGQGDEPLDAAAILERSRTGKSGMLIVGPPGSGRSSVLRLLGRESAAACKNLGFRGVKCVYPVLLRANQLEIGEGSVEDQILEAIRRNSGAILEAPLPPSFLTDLVESPGIRLLVMVDGLDEIQNSRDLAEIVDLLDRIPKDPGFGAKTHLLITSRPSTAEHFRYSDFEIYEIQPFGLQAIEIAAAQWLGARAGSFLRKNGNLLESGLLSSPLVLAVSMKLFEREEASLPVSVVELHRRLVQQCNDDWRRTLVSEYGADVVEHGAAVLGALALEILRSSTVQDREWLLEAAARCFAERFGFESSAARAASRRFAAFASADSGFLRRTGEHFYWSHLSFRDYLAANCLIETSPPESAAEEILKRWFDVNWGKAPAFAIALIEDAAERASIVERILGSGREERFDFVAALLQEGVELPEQLRLRVVETLALKSDEERDDYAAGPKPGARSALAFDLLLSLSGLAPGRAALEAIASNPEWPDAMRRKARERLQLKKPA